MTLLLLYFEFFKTGLFAVGGGLATLPFLYDMSDRLGWFTHQDLSNLIAISESTPGPIGVNAATYVGFLTAGPLGSLLATLGLMTPSVIIILLIAQVLDRFRANPLVEKVFYGLRPASTGLIAAAGFLVLKTTLWDSAALSMLSAIRWPSVVLAVVLYLAIKKWDKHPIWYLAAAALIGILLNFSA
ncbi:MAG: chromate transporter [Butyricicoccus sp.]|nr:chromate transporter [Butyricicoccus sp.]